MKQIILESPLHHQLMPNKFPSFYDFHFVFSQVLLANSLAAVINMLIVIATVCSISMNYFDVDVMQDPL